MKPRRARVHAVVRWVTRSSASTEALESDLAGTEGNFDVVLGSAVEKVLQEKAIKHK